MGGTPTHQHTHTHTHKKNIYACARIFQLQNHGQETSTLQALIE